MRTELNEDELSLLAIAREAGLSAYAPYSKFRVGAAVRSDAGVFVGCNIENASFGLSICAERSAIFAAVSNGAKYIEMLAVSCLDAEDKSTAGRRMPCGACRQVIAEFANISIPVIVDGAGVWHISELMPQPFVL